LNHKSISTSSSSGSCAELNFVLCNYWNVIAVMFMLWV